MIVEKFDTLLDPSVKTALDVVGERLVVRQFVRDPSSDSVVPGTEAPPTSTLSRSPVSRCGPATRNTE